jgi:muramoyltetrapeptide carboxypeptidase
MTSPATPRLPPGSTIAVVAPSGVHDSRRLAASIGLIQSWGYRVRRMPNLGARHRYTAGTRDQRAADLYAALTAPDVQAVWFARGGYGTVHLLDGLPSDKLDDRLIMGFSDATALFSVLVRHGAHAVHGPVLHSLADHVDAASLEATRTFLQTGRPVILSGEHLAGPALEVEGPVVGGNLCVLASLAGTPHALDARGCILVLEEVNEAPYKLDRLLTQLILSGGLDGVRGVALGSITGAWMPPGADWTAQDVVVELLRPLGLPVIGGLPVGHGPRNHPWPVGARGRLGPDGLRVG